MIRYIYHMVWKIYKYIESYVHMVVIGLPWIHIVHKGVFMGHILGLVYVIYFVLLPSAASYDVGYCHNSVSLSICLSICESWMALQLPNMISNTADAQ